jgi:hypothetical protein
MIPIKCSKRNKYINRRTLSTCLNASLAARQTRAGRRLTLLTANLDRARVASMAPREETKRDLLSWATTA